MIRLGSGFEVFLFLWWRADSKRGKGGVDAFLRWVETLVVFPARFVSVCFGCMGEGRAVWVDPR